MFADFPIDKILFELKKENLLPGILFRTSRKQCDADAEKAVDFEDASLSEDQQQILESEVREVIGKYGMDESVIVAHSQYDTLVRTGVGAHHAGQLLLWRLLLEELMIRGKLRLMIATGTVAAGVDFPARTVIITAHSRRSSEGFAVLSASEFRQMSGRAGRRGKDAVGICLVAPSRFSDARVIHAVSKKLPEPLRSSYFAAPSTMLNLLKFRNADDLDYTVSKSLASFLDRKNGTRIREEADQQEKISELEDKLNDYEKKRLAKRIRRMRRDADILDNKQQVSLQAALAHLERLGHIEQGVLTEKGYWAAELCTTLVLELAEVIDQHLLTDLDATQLIAIIGAISGDSHRSYLSFQESPIEKKLYQAVDNELARVLETAGDRAIGYQVEVIPEAGLTVLRWMESESWTEFSGLLRLAGVAEGDIARLVNQTADHLNQISRLLDSHPDLARRAADARRLILKPPLTEGLAVQ